MVELTSEERHNAEEFFNHIDRNHDGKVTLEEFLQSQKDKVPGSQPLSEEQAREWFNEWDMNGDGVIDAKEFWNGVLLNKRGSRPSIMKDLWKRIDEDQDGFITKADVLRFFNNLGFGEVDDESPLDALFEKYDTDHDGKLNFDDFLLFSEPAFGNA